MSDPHPWYLLHDIVFFLDYKRIFGVRGKKYIPLCNQEDLGIEPAKRDEGDDEKEEEGEEQPPLFDEPSQNTIGHDASGQGRLPLNIGRKKLIRLFGWVLKFFLWREHSNRWIIFFSMHL